MGSKPFDLGESIISEFQRLLERGREMRMAVVTSATLLAGKESDRMANGNAHAATK